MHMDINQLLDMIDNLNELTEFDVDLLADENGNEQIFISTCGKDIKHKQIEKWWNNL